MNNKRSFFYNIFMTLSGYKWTEVTVIDKMEFTGHDFFGISGKIVESHKEWQWIK